MPARFEFPLVHRGDPASREIVDGESDLPRLVDDEFDPGRGIEGVGVVLMQQHAPGRRGLADVDRVVEVEVDVVVEDRRTFVVRCRIQEADLKELALETRVDFEE